MLTYQFHLSVLLSICLSLQFISLSLPFFSLSLSHTLTHSLCLLFKHYWEFYSILVTIMTAHIYSSFFFSLLCRLFTVNTPSFISLCSRSMSFSKHYSLFSRALSLSLFQPLSFLTSTTHRSHILTLCPLSCLMMLLMEEELEE